MNTWIYRALMAVLAVILAAQLWMLTTAKPQPEQCLLGIVMQQHQHMWQQKGLWPTYCIPIDKD